jgi:uncharacterized protein YbjT (DUF2867 family)
MSTTGSNTTPRGQCQRVDSLSHAIPIWHWTKPNCVSFARLFRDSSPGAMFAFLSGSGADPTGRSRMAFARYKGEAEKALSAARFPRVLIFRPAYPVVPRREPNLSYRLLRAIYPAFRLLFPNQVIRADDLARTMVDAAVHDIGADRRVVVLENRDIRAPGAS